MEDARDKYHRLFFSSEIGKEVLDDILTHCFFGCTLDPANPAMIARHNVGTFILSRCGVFAEGTAPQVLNALASVVPKQQEDEE
jgi:hypothetical protein